MREEWRPVVDYPGYEVSNFGQVRGKRGGLLKQQTDPNGYRTVNLAVPGMLRTLRVHALVLIAFVGPRPAGMLSRHLNDVPTNNRLDNLAWGSARDNQLDSVRNGSHRNARKTACDRGHEFVPFNTTTVQGKRRCVACNRAGVEVWRAAQRGEALDIQAVADRRFREQRQAWRDAQREALVGAA